MCVTPPRRCAALDMCTAILRGMKIIVTIPKAAPVVTVARTIIIAAWGISRSIAMVMAAAIRMSMQQSSTMTAAVAMIMVLTRSMSIITTSMESMMTMSVAVGTSMKSMMTMSAAAGMSITTTTHIMCRGILRIVNVKFAILTRSTAMFVAKA